MGLWLAVAASTGLILACNAIAGVGDVTLQQKDSQDGGDDPGSSGDPGSSSSSGTNPGGGDAAPPAVSLSLAVGSTHTCVARGDGRVLCWGQNAYSELSKDETTLAKSDNVVVVDGVANVAKVCAGDEFTCALTKDGIVSCWGQGTDGQLGSGVTTRSLIGPARVSGLTGVTDISCGRSFACAVATGGTISCWGDNRWGQLGDKTMNQSNVPVAVKGVTNATKVSAGFYHTCAVLNGGGLVCWGANDKGQCGNGRTATQELDPQTVPGIANVQEVALGSDFTCARSGNQTVTCFGKNDYGQIGNGTNSTDGVTAPTAVAGLSDPAFMSAGQNHICVVRVSGKVSCWGDASAGQLGAGLDASDGGAVPPQTRPNTVISLMTAARVGAGDTHSCAATSTGEVYCWGTNTYGQLGDGTEAAKFIPQLVKGFTKN
jgi:alpha-tubulin suppressor-like RCC1 family protein